MLESYENSVYYEEDQLKRIEESKRLLALFEAASKEEEEKFHEECNRLRELYKELTGKKD